MGGRVNRTQSHNDWSRGGGGSALALILALHAGALWGLMQIESVREAVQEAVPIMVGLVTLAPPEPPKPKIEPPPPKPRPVKPKPQPQMIAAQTEAPAAITAPLPEPVPAIEEPPPAPPPPAAEPAPVIPPNFLAAYLDNPAPAYPASSKRLGETGTVLLRVLVDERGRAESVDVATSSGFERLDRAAIDAVRRWKFVPARQGDRAVKAAVIVPLEFQLSSS